MVIEQEKPDLVLLIPPITEYVDDGFRAMRWASDRYRFHETLVRVIQESPYADRVVTLDNPTFEGRKAQAIQADPSGYRFMPPCWNKLKTCRAIAEIPPARILAGGISLA